MFYGSSANTIQNTTTRVRKRMPVTLCVPVCLFIVTVVGAIYQKLASRWQSVLEFNSFGR